MRNFRSFVLGATAAHVSVVYSYTTDRTYLCWSLLSVGCHASPRNYPKTSDCRELPNPNIWTARKEWKINVTPATLSFFRFDSDLPDSSKLHSSPRVPCFLQVPASKTLIGSPKPHNPPKPHNFQIHTIVQIQTFIQNHAISQNWAILQNYAIQQN